MRSKVTPFILLLTIVSFFSCQDEKSKIPYIEFVSVSETYMNQNASDSLYLKFKFTDGDGNIGSDTSDNIFVKDSRTDLLIGTYKIPNYLGENTNNACRTGEVTLVVYSQCCIYPDSSSCGVNSAFPTRDMRYTIQVKDELGNYSNIIKSSKITLECN